MRTDRAPTRNTAARHAARLLVDVGLDPAMLPSADAPHPDVDWAQSGAGWLTGWPHEAPRPMHAPVAACARGAALALAALSPALAALDLDAPALLGERAALAGLHRAGRTTAGGAGRLLRTRDGWLAVQLPRPDDLEALPAWLEARGPGDGDVFTWLAEELAGRSRDLLIERARWLGLAVAPLPASDASSGSSTGPRWLRRNARPETTTTPPARPRAPGAAPLRVLDLSTLWAGPLCGALLALAGADVVKLEHADRPDGARLGPSAFFDLMHGDKSNVALDLRRSRDRAQLHALIEAADIVIESARPRALAQLGIDAQALVDAHPGLTWLSITGYGRPRPGGDRTAFGDDAAVAAGLVARDDAGQPVFCADAVADPLTGLHAAVAALAGARSGGGLYDVSLAGVAHMVAQAPRCEPPRGDAAQLAMAPPRARTPRHIAHTIGADSEAVCARWCRVGGGARPC